MISYATIYNPVPSLVGSRLLDQMDHVKTYKEIRCNSLTTGLFIELNSGSTVTLNFALVDDLNSRLNSFMSFAQETIADKDQQSYALSRIRDTRLTIGCVIKPGLDPDSDNNDNQVLDLLFEINNRLSGLLLLNDAIWDYDAKCLTDEVAE